MSTAEERKENGEGFSALHEAIRDLDVDVKKLTETMSEVKETLAMMRGQGLEKRLEKQSERITRLEKFQDRAVGGFLIINFLWVIIGGLIVWFITKAPH